MDAYRIARKMADECPAMRVREASRVLGRFFDEELRPLGLQLSQLPLLCAAALTGEDGAPIGALARALALDPTTLTRNVRPLEKSGLLRVARSPKDRRARVVLLTRAGERMLESVYPAWQRALGQVEAEFGSDRIERVKAQLTALVAMSAGSSGPGDSPRRRER